MNTNLKFGSDSNLQEAKEYLQDLDLSYIVQTMCAENYPLPRWSLEDAKHCCKLYKNFLYLHKKYPNVILVPTREIDEFWHNHILYTKKYLQDCMKLFGHFFHHDPADPSEESKSLIENYMKTKELYLDEFNEPLKLIQN